MSQESQNLLTELGGKSNNTSQQTLNIKDIFYKYIRYFPFLVLSVALSLLTAYIYLRYTVPTYSSVGIIQLGVQTGGRSSEGDKVEDLLFGSNKGQELQSEIEVIKSKPLMARVINKLGLQLNYTALGRIRDENVYNKAPFFLHVHELTDSNRAFSLSISFDNEINFSLQKESQTLKVGELFKNNFGVFSIVKTAQITPGSDYQIDWIPTKSLARKYAASLSVSPRPTGKSLVITMESTSPQLAADLINTTMIQYDSLTIEQSNFSTDQMIGFIDIRLDTLKRELDELQGKVIDYRLKENLIDVTAQSGNYFNNISGLENKLINEQAILLSIEIVNNYLKDKANEFKKVVVPSSLGISDATLNNLISNYNGAQITRQTLIESNIPLAHPSIKQAEALIEQQRLMVLENLRNLKYAANNSVKEIDKNITINQQKWHEIPAKNKELIALERQVNTKQTLYSLLEGRREEATLSRASTISSSKILEEAYPSRTPVTPNKGLIRIIAILIGIAVPVVIILLKEILNDKINTKNDITRVSDVPILGEVGRSTLGKALVVNKTSRTMVAEQFRTIRSNLQYITNNISQPVIMITSSFSGEGKSFFSTNMGAVLALSGKKTIVLEFDIRKPMLLAGLGMVKKPGISNYIVGKAQLSDLIIQVPDAENLFVLPCGPIPPNPSELLLDRKITELFAYLKTQFDVIIIDTAPVGIVSDALTLGKFADATLYITRQGYTYKKQINMVDDLYTQKKLPKMSVIVNDVTAGHGYGYYGYGKYGYSYTKNDYYVQETESKPLLRRILDTLNPFKWFSNK